MANEKDNKQKEVTTAPGADSTSVTKADTPVTGDEQKETQTGPLIMEVEVPQWAVELKELCQQVIDAIGQFNENAEKVVRDIIQEAKSVGQGKAEKPEQTAPIVKINKKARYVVAPKGKIMSNATGAVLTEGADVTDFDAERLVNLIAQGVVIEASDK